MTSEQLYGFIAAGKTSYPSVSSGGCAGQQQRLLRLDPPG
jgi:hypothetical protein